jgi:hypothetical protein
MPRSPVKCMGKNVRLKPTKANQNAILPSFSDNSLFRAIGKK